MKFSSFRNTDFLGWMVNMFMKKEWKTYEVRDERMAALLSR